MTPPVRRPSSSRSATRISLRIVARASRETVVGMRAGFLLVRVTAAPVDGAANAALHVIANLATTDHALREHLRAFRARQTEAARAMKVPL